MDIDRLTYDYPGFQFEIIKKDKHSSAKLGILHTPHGSIETPNFIFCATKAAIRGVDVHTLKQCGVDIILSNTYHLMLQPSATIVAKAGGLQEFTRWQGPMLTDSGGFQIFSLNHGGVVDEIKGKGKSERFKKSFLKLDETGATFRSHIDGSIHQLTPEKSIQIQSQLGADLILQLDECTASGDNKSYTKDSMLMSQRWGDRSLQEFLRLEGTGSAGKQALYGISQGGIYEDLRQHSNAYLNSRPFFGNAIGGSLGQTKAQMYRVVKTCMNHLNHTRPTHLLGIGYIDDILHTFTEGIDTYDCVSPTRLARHCGALIFGKANGSINLKNARFKADYTPIDNDCDCSTCVNGYTKAYIHHLIKAKELLFISLLIVHNIRGMVRFFTSVREAIREDRVQAFQRTMLFGQ